MIGFDEALSRLGEAAQPLGVESVAIDDASGRVLAAPALTHRDAPATAVSTMDGYAVCAADHRAGAKLQVIGESRPAVPFRGSVAPGGCVRLLTGAEVPDGGEIVVIQEHVRRERDWVLITEAAAQERYIRLPGSDFRMGEALVAPGVKLGPASLIAAAAGDNDRLDVFRKPTLALLATGDELVSPGEARGRSGFIPDSGSPGVAALAEAYGATIGWRTRLADDRGRLEQAAAEMLEGADVAVVIGGASVGDRDFARAMFEPFGLELIYSGVRIKPGKPVWLGRAGGRLVVGLPGNPGSALVTARLFLAPLIYGLGGRPWRDALNWRPAALATPLPATGERETFWRARLQAGAVAVVADQQSGAQKALALADRLIRRRPGEPACRAGEVVQALDL